MIIDETKTTESDIYVSGLNVPLSPYSIITLQIWLTHTWNADLIIRLYGPDGSHITLSNQRGFDFENVFDGTLFTDSAKDSVSTYLFSNNVVASSLRPERPFSNFRGKYPNGKWKLWIKDVYPWEDNGKLNGVIMNIQGFFYFFQK